MSTLSFSHPTACFVLGPTIVEYRIEANGVVSFSFLPTDRGAHRVVKRAVLDEPEVTRLPALYLPMPAQVPDSLVQLHVRGKDLDFSPPTGFGHGLTLHGGEASDALHFKSQSYVREGTVTRIETVVAAEEGFSAIHILEWKQDEPFLRVWTEFHNDSEIPLTLDLLTSFSFSGITPFHPADGPGRLFRHRIRSAWSAEGRVESTSIEDLHLERSWSGHGVTCERFGVVGSMPARGFFPVVGIEDREAGTLWGAQLHAASSWQMEVFRRGDELCVAGGLADREFGHWTKTVQTGGSFAAPEVVLATVCGDFQDLCHVLTSSQNTAADLQPAHERELPVVFNEWCASWGNPNHASITATAKRLRNIGVLYFVIDDGWAERPGGAFQQNGDWIVSRGAFPHGLKATCDAIRAVKMIPGIWFEFEVCNEGSKAWDLMDHQLRRDGRALRVGSRRFWDFRDPWTFAYLTEKVISLLRDHGFGYLKVDYNDTLGIGVDGPDGDGSGEHLRQHMAGVHEFFRAIRRELPDLVIENCSSGGHRLEPSMQALCAMGSFSDAHETLEIPIIAAHQHKVVLPRQLQVWAVLRPEESASRTDYSLAATFLGRMALSGDMTKLPEWKMDRVREAIAFYQLVVPVILAGRSRLLESPTGSWRHPSGRQVLSRISEDGRLALVVVHTFSEAPNDPLRVPLPEGKWRVKGHFGQCDDAWLEQGELHIPAAGDLSGQVYLLEKLATDSPSPSRELHHVTATSNHRYDSR